MQILKRVYGAEPTALGARISFSCDVLRCQLKEKGEKSKVECEELRGQIVEALESEIESQRSRVERKRRNFEAATSSNITVPSSSIVEPIQRYYAANAREFKQLLEAFERVRRMRKS